MLLGFLGRHGREQSPCATVLGILAQELLHEVLRALRIARVTQRCGQLQARAAVVVVQLQVRGGCLDRSQARRGCFDVEALEVREGEGDLTHLPVVPETCEWFDPPPDPLDVALADEDVRQPVPHFAGQAIWLSARACREQMRECRLDQL